MVALDFHAIAYGLGWNYADVWLAREYLDLTYRYGYLIRVR